MKPFEKALIDAILEEYEGIPPHKEQKNQYSQMTFIHNICPRHHNKSEQSNYCIWIEPNRKNIYFSPHVETILIFFRNQLSMDTGVERLIEMGYRIKEN